MDATSTTRSPSTRLKLGVAIIAASQVVDVTRIASHLQVFLDVHSAYAEAQRLVHEGEAKAAAARDRLRRFDLRQHDAIEDLARVLAVDTRSRLQPFAAFGGDPPWVLKRLAFADTARALHRLVAAVRARNKLAPATHAAAANAERAARAMEEALLAAEVLGREIDALRQARNVIGLSWETALAGLRRAARVAVDDGAIGLYAALFGKPRRRRRRASRVA